MGVDIFSNPAMAICFIQVLRQREESRYRHAVHKNTSSSYKYTGYKYTGFKRTGRLVSRKLGVALMRLGGKLVYLGTNPYEQNIY